jgi:hypothetical protein
MKTSELVVLMKLRELPNSIQNLAICSQYISIFSLGGSLNFERAPLKLQRAITINR